MPATTTTLHRLRKWHDSGHSWNESAASRASKLFLEKASREPVVANRWSSQDKELLYRLYKDKQSIKQIHSHFPTRTHWAIRAVINAARAEHEDTDSRNWTADYLRRVKAMRDGGASWKRIQGEAFPYRTLHAIRFAYARTKFSHVLPETKIDWTQQDQTQFERLIREGKSLHEIQQTSFPQVSRTVLVALSRKFREKIGNSFSNESRWWNIDEEQRLANLIGTSHNVKQISEMMHRSINSVNKKANKLGLKALPGPKVRQPNWTAEEIAVLEPTLGMRKSYAPQLKRTSA